MEFSFDLEKILPGRVTVIECSDINEGDIKIFALPMNSDEQSDPSNSWIYHYTANSPWDIRLKKRKEELCMIIDVMGLASAQAQSLRSPITTLKKLLNSKQQKIYMLRDESNNKAIIGFLKIGTKRLFVCDEIGAHHKVDPLCILDFYIHESKQRCGFGHELFDIMLQVEKVLPEKLAIDRPSFKFLSFLCKHYNLKNHIVQANNFVIYPGFFHNREAVQPVKSSASKQQNINQSSMNESEAFNSIKVSLCPDELKKNKTFYSSAAKCLMWNDEKGDTSSCNKRHHSENLSAHSQSYNYSNVKSSDNWHVNMTAQTCSEAHKKMDRWSSSHSTPCSLTPINNVPSCSQRKWDQMQSSWNILGVKPIDYSVYQKQN